VLKSSTFLPVVSMKVYRFPGFSAVVAYKWLILQYMLEYTLSRNEIWVPRREIRRYFNIDERVLSTTLKRMEAEGWVVSGLNKRYKRYYRLGWRARKFLERYEDFIANNPYVKKA
jgi:DNA-binding transcriptional regulator PaaX